GREAADPEARRGLLEEARKPETKLIIATSAGDEGIDIPEVDLLVFWSHVSSPLRLYQRLGRALRPSPDRIKYAVFIVTPGTRDYDALPESLVALAREGIDVSGIFDDVGSQVLGEGLLMARKVKEVAQAIGVSGVTGELLLGTLAQSARVRRRVLRELEEGARVGAIYYFYDLDEAYAQLQSQIEAGMREIYIRLGASNRRYVAKDEAEEAVRNHPESFSPSPLCLDPLKDLKVKGASEEAVKSLQVELLRRISSSATPSEIASVIGSVAQENPAAAVRWRLRVEAALLPINGNEVLLMLTADYGPFLARNVKQIEYALMNTSALWRLISSLAAGSDGLGFCDRLLRLSPERRY
ncbi:MAG: helicase-related protein, partial [Thermofilaceae archaeon]